MNPPAALHGAMSRDRKPFTYTPGGLDLSEIKSERMAKRLMRNAMNEGVPQQPVQPIQSPPAGTIAVPNFNCLPVQVFPAFQLPANPKSLLRTRSNPVSREPPPRASAQFVNNKAPVYDTFNKNTPPYSQINNNRPTSMFEHGDPVAPFMNYVNETHNAPFYKNNSNTLPEMSYDAQYLQAPNINSHKENSAPAVIKSDIVNEDSWKAKEEAFSMPIYDLKNSLQSQTEVVPSVIKSKEHLNDITPETIPTAPEVVVIIETQIPDDVSYNNEQKEVKTVTKEAKSETKIEKQNGEQNGDTEAVMTVKLPTKKSAAKTETKVEITKKTLPDGSIEEIKKTITKTTIDGRTEIKTKTETTIIPKDDEEEEEEEEEEVEEVEVNEGIVTEVDESEAKEQSVATVVKVAEPISSQISENGQDNIIKTEERSETTTTSTKKVVVIQDDKNDEEQGVQEEVEEEEIKEAEPVTIILKKQPEPSPSEDEVEEEEEEENQVEEVIVKKVELENEEKTESEEEKPAPKEVIENDEKEELVEEEEEFEEAKENEVEVPIKKESETVKLEPKEEEEEVSEYTDEEIEPEKVEVKETPVEEPKVEDEEATAVVEENKVSTQEPAETPVEKVTPVEIEIPIQKESDQKEEVVVEKQSEIKQEVTEETKTEKTLTSEPRVPLREPSVPLERVEDVEIKPIGAGNFITKTRTETTEIVTGTGVKPTGLLTEFNRTENIVTVNRTTKTLDYENSAPQTIPTLTYFTPHIEKFPPSPQPTNRPYQPVYPTEPTSERRHSLLLERLSVERQIPTSEIYQNTQQYNQTLEQQNQWSQEPRVEILNIENVKPSSITKEQWYQQTDKVYNNVAPTAPPVAPSWTQPKPQQQAYQPPPQPAYQPQPNYQAQQPKPAYQPPQPQPVYQSQPQYQPQPQYQAQPQQQYQATTLPQTQPQYQTSYTENLQQNISSQQNTYSTQQNYSTYTPKPTSWDTPRIIEPNQYSSDTYQNTQQSSASYIPPPWEQDSNYVANNTQNYYQPQTQYAPDVKQDWKPTQPAPKFTKTTPTAYIPPKPNQSFVKHVTIAEPPKQAGRKTYYSEYERRYISVPESTYIPGETKPQPQQIQTQPDPSPAYYYDNNEPAETVEHQWRKELREFTEKAQTQPPENVKPPWETIETKTQSQYAKTQETYTATPTWSQTLRPQSWRERSFESEFVNQEWPKTNTLGRGRPLSTSYGRESSVPERTRGVSVDRYNPNNYQAPVPEPHPPVQTFTHNPPAPHATGYHNPHVPAYHARASAEPREQPVYQQPRQRVESRASPFQSRSFKYLQWITGTDD